MTSNFSAFSSRLRDYMAGVQLLDGSSTEVFNTLALELFALQFTHNAPYGRFCQARGATPDIVEHWTQIPAIPAVAFKEFDLTSLPPGERTAVFHSSGTTNQQASRHFHSSDSLAVYEASLWQWFQVHMLPDFQNRRPAVGPPETNLGRQIFPLRSHSDGRGEGQGEVRVLPSTHLLAILTPPPTQAPHSSLVHMFETVRQRSNASQDAEPSSLFFGRVADHGGWTLDFDATLAYLHEATNGNQPLVLLGTAFSFVHLLDFLGGRGQRFHLPAGSRVMETGGYKGRSRTLPKTELHALITKHLGIPPTHIVCEYGMSELSSQAYDKVTGDLSDTRVFRFPPWAAAQIVSPETGREVAESETGLVRIFDLANVFSVMAIQTEDLAIRREVGFELIGRAAIAEPRGCSLLSADASIVNLL